MKFILYFCLIVFVYPGGSLAQQFDWDSSAAVSIPEKKEKSLRIVWWNIQYGETDRLLNKSGSTGVLSNNLNSLINSESAPDVIAFGEYENGVIDSDVESNLKKLYPYHPKKFVPYNSDTPERGLHFFSKYPLKLKRSETLDYYPLGMKDASEIQKYKSDWASDFPPERFFPRTYLNYSVSIEGEEFHIVPFHALIHAEKEFKESGGGFFAETLIKLRMVFGTQNPMIYQLQRLKRAINKDFGPKVDPQRVVLIGDFNLPRKFFGIQTAPYKVVSAGLKDAFENQEVITWPLPSSAEFKKYSLRAQIDQCFCSFSTSCTSATVLPLKGSDHSALLVDVVY